MTIRETLRGALRRLAGAGAPRKRHTLALPSILQTYGPRADVLPKPTPQNLRRFAETPVARKAINAVKDRVAGMRWRVQPKNGRALDELPDAADRIRILTDNFDAPNADDSFRSLVEQVLEDVIVGGFGAIEVQPTGEAARPLNLWPVDGASIRMRTDWDGRPDSPRYVQVTGAYGPNAQIVLNDDELSYIRLNPRTHTPFGLGRLEVAFETISAFLGAHRYAARLASNSVVQYALWLQDLGPAQHERVIRWWQDEIEGTGRVPILSVENKPEVLRFGGGNESSGPVLPGIVEAPLARHTIKRPNRERPDGAATPRQRLLPGGWPHAEFRPFARAFHEIQPVFCRGRIRGYGARPAVLEGE